MKVFLYSIVDQKKKELKFSTPYSAENDEDAKRSFQSFLVNNRIVDAADFQLMCVGSYNTSTGFIDGDDGGRVVMSYDLPDDVSDTVGAVKELSKSVNK